MDRITVKATPNGTLNYTYDAAGHVASIASANPNGTSMSYTYDDLNRLAAGGDTTGLLAKKLSEKIAKTVDAPAVDVKAKVEEKK